VSGRAEPGDPGDLGWHPEPDLVDYRDPAARAALRNLGEATWSAALDYLYAEAMRRPVAPLTPDELRERFFGTGGRPAPAPESPATAAEVLAEVAERVLPFAYNPHHPRSFSYFTSPPLPLSVSGDVLASWLQQSVDVFHASPVGTLLEEEVAGWLRDLVGAGPDGAAVLTSGGVMANVMALTVVRDVHLRACRRLGRPPRAAELDGVRVYCSDQSHFSIGRALDLLGFPPDTLHVLASDDRFRLPPRRLAEAVAADRAAGLLPLAVCAVSGTTNTGSVDPVPALADVAAREGLWLHVDAAYGGAARLSARDAGRVPGLDRADSVTVDPHKWFFQAIDIGALVVRRRTDLHRTFTRRPEYYRSAEGGTAEHGDPMAWMEFSMEGTRRLRGLKLWMSWKHLGTAGLGRLVERTNDLAAELSALLRAGPDFEVAVPEPDLSVVCFRHLPGTDDGRPARSDDELDAHQDAVYRALAASGAAWVSTTRLRGRTWLRAGVVNHMTRPADLPETLAALRAAAAAAG
jgi:glutamate/tyrosine decarboxylase-like PLP-dependent enzyme